MRCAPPGPNRPVSRNRCLSSTLRSRISPCTRPVLSCCGDVANRDALPACAPWRLRRDRLRSGRGTPLRRSPLPGLPWVVSVRARFCDRCAAAWRTVVCLLSARHLPPLGMVKIRGPARVPVTHRGPEERRCCSDASWPSFGPPHTKKKGGAPPPVGRWILCPAVITCL